MVNTQAAFLVFTSIFCVFLSIPKWSYGSEYGTADPYRTIAILEDQRSLKAQPGITLSAFFQSSDPKIRSRSVLAAGRIGNKQMIPDLRLLVTDHEADVRRKVAFALGQIRAKEALPLILQLMKDKDIEVRRLAIEAAGRTGGLEIAAEIAAFLEDPNVSLREQSALALALIKDKNTVPALIKKVKLNDPAQWSYVYALYRLADERSIPALHDVLKKPELSTSTGDPSSLLFALKALWSMKKPLTPDEADRFLKDGDPRIMQNALDVIGAAGDRNACELILKRFDQMNTLTKLKAIEALSVLECASENQIISMLGHSDLAVRAAAIQLIPAGKREQQKDLFETRAGDSQWQIRWQTARAGAGFESKSGIALLSRLAKDSDSMVKLAAIESLGAYMPESASLLIPLLKSNDFAERASAADILGKANDAKFLPDLIEAYEFSADPGEVEGRVAILDALSNYNDSSVLALFDKALMDPDYTIRRHAIDGIKKLAGNRYFRDGELIDPESFLYSDIAVSQTDQDKYAQNFGSPVPEYIAEMNLEKGTAVIRLFNNDAPNHVLSFKKLADSKFYDGLRIHRVVPNFVIQGGDPRGDGWGGGGVSIRDEANLLQYRRAMVGMPLAGKDTGGSQFFITMSRQPHLDGNYTIFGEVISGMEFVDSTQVGDRIRTVLIKTSKDTAGLSKK